MYFTNQYYHFVNIFLLLLTLSLNILHFYFTYNGVYTIKNVFRTVNVSIIVIMLLELSYLNFSDYFAINKNITKIFVVLFVLSIILYILPMFTPLL